MEAALNGWSRKEILVLIKVLNCIDFNKLEKLIPAKSRKQIKEAVLFMINDMGDAPPVTDRITISELQEFIKRASKDPNVQRSEVLNPQIIKLLTAVNYVPPPERVLNIDIRELFNQMANAMQNKPVVADSAIIEFLQMIVEEAIERSGGYISPKFKEFISRIEASAIPMPPTTSKHHQRPTVGGMYNKPIYTAARSGSQPEYKPAKTNYNASYASAKTNNPPVYSPATSPLEPLLTPVTSNYNQIYAPANCNYSPIYAPQTCNYNMIYASANANYVPVTHTLDPNYASAKPNFPATCCFQPLYVNTHRHFEPINMPVRPPGREPSSRRSGNGAYRAEPNGQYQYSHTMNRDMF